MQTGKRFLLIVALLLMVGATTWADTVPSGSVVGPTADGGISVRFPAGADVKPRDVFVIAHGGKPLGECLVVSVKGNLATLLPKANFSGTAARGDEAVFVRHAVAVNSIHDNRHAVMPTWSHGDVKDADGWYTISVPEGPFEVHMPGQPEANLAPEGCSWKYEDKQSRYMVVFAETKKTDIDWRDPLMQRVAFIELSQAMAHEFGGHAGEPRLGTVSGCPGCNFEIADAKPPFSHVEIMMFVSGERVYQLSVESAPGTHTNSRHFFTTMKLTPAAAVSKAGPNGMQRYSDDAGFTLSYPAEARFTRDPAEIARLLRTKERSDSIRCILVLAEGQIMSFEVQQSPVATTQALGDLVLSVATEKLHVTDPEGPTEILLGGKGFRSLTYSIEDLRERCVLFVRPDTHEAYVIRCYAATRNFNQAAAAFEQVLNSMSFNF